MLKYTHLLSIWSKLSSISKLTYAGVNLAQACCNEDTVLSVLVRYNWPIIWSVLFPTLFPAFLEKSGPKHSTSVPFSARPTVPLNVDMKEVALIPNPVPEAAIKGLPDPQGAGACVVLCVRMHSSPTFQRVIPCMSPVTVHLKVKVSPGQVGGGAMNCPKTLPGDDFCNYTSTSCLYLCITIVDRASYGYHN